MLSDVIKQVLFIAVAFGLRYLLSALKIEIDEATFNAIVASLVGYLLALFGYSGVRALANKSRPGLLK